MPTNAFGFNHTFRCILAVLFSLFLVLWSFYIINTHPFTLRRFFFIPQRLAISPQGGKGEGRSNDLLAGELTHRL